MGSAGYRDAGSGHERYEREEVFRMPLGPIELLEVQVPGNQFTGGIIPALSELVENGTIRIIDILFIK